MMKHCGYTKTCTVILSFSNFFIVLSCFFLFSFLFHVKLLYYSTYCTFCNYVVIHNCRPMHTRGGTGTVGTGAASLRDSVRLAGVALASLMDGTKPWGCTRDSGGRGRGRGRGCVGVLDGWCEALE